MAFVRAERRRARLRLALLGPAGSGKTFSALKIAQHLGERVALIDTENGSAVKYGGDFHFDVMELTDHHPKTGYVEAIQAAAQAGYPVLIIDSLSHAWSGKNGALELVDRKARSSNNAFSGWRDVTPLHNALVDAILSYPGHVMITLRVKMAYVQEKDEKGRTVIRKVGLQPVQREGVEYEFDVIGDMDLDHRLMIGKTRCSALDGKEFSHPGKDVADILTGWLNAGSAPSAPSAPAPEPTRVPATEAQGCAVCGEGVDTLQAGISLAALGFVACETHADAASAPFDPSWVDDEEAFRGTLEEMKIDFAALALRCLARYGKRPEQMDDSTRQEVLSRLLEKRK